MNASHQAGWMMMSRRRASVSAELSSHSKTEPSSGGTSYSSTESPHTSQPVDALSLSLVSLVIGSEKLAMNLSVKSAGRGRGSSVLCLSGFDDFWRRRSSPEAPQVVRSLTKWRSLVRASMACVRWFGSSEMSCLAM